MIDRDALTVRLGVLEGYLRELRLFLEHDRAAFSRTASLHHLAERYLHLACESVLDIAHHVIAGMGYRQPQTYREAMEILAEQGHVEPQLAERLKGWMGLRNILVHLYLVIDHGRIYDAIRDDLHELESFLKSMTRLAAGP